ncbi:MAG: TIGR01841 family phasin [Pseudomonadota bacterium]
MANQNPFADMMKTFSEFKMPTMGAMPSMPAMPSFDVTALMNVSRRNAEACSAASQMIAEGCQALARRQAELARAQVEKSLKSTKDMLVNGSPEINTTKQVDLAKTMFESNLNNLREAGEVVSKMGFEVFNIYSRRASESIEEISSTATSTATKRKAA